MRFQEIETKYRAQDIKLQDFIQACEAQKPLRRVDVGSFDHYYVREDGCALRFRDGPRPELTVKQKQLDRNNFVRTEVNLPLAPGTAREIVDKFAALKGYRHDFTIFKTCVIFYWERHNAVFYVVYDENLNEKDRFMEIEMSESHDWDSEAAAWAELQGIEKQFAGLGISPARRMRKSLQEMFTQVSPMKGQKSDAQ